ncbi:MAG: type I 3-dehydroquinate dehydratase [Holophagales bacterium]|nr:type I 3-dehydroquinate dehydratase [Holophagales bacterium]
MNPTTDEPRTATLVASLTEAPSASGDEVRSLSELADCLEVRAELGGDVAVELFFYVLACYVIYTLRSEAEGGRGTVEPERRAALLSAAAGYDLVDLEADRDLGRTVLDAVEPRRRVVSWHGRARNLKVLQGRLRQVSGVEARLYKLVTEARDSGDELVPLELLLGAGRADIAAFSMGAVGAWTRLVGPRLGAPWIYGAAGPLAAAPGQPSIERLRVDYGLPKLHRASRLFGVVGHPAAHSLSPRLHNAGYRDRREEALYVAFDAPNFETFWREIVSSDFFDRAGLPLSGLSVTAPHKAAALAAASEAGPLARGTQGANTLLPGRNGATSRRWRAESTDPEGVTGPLRRGGMDLRDREAVVIGAGGAGRAAALGLAVAGARVALANRTESTGRAAAESLGVTFVPLEEVKPGDFDIVVNATSLGHRADDPLPCDPAALRASAVAVELVYGGGPTRWSRALSARGLVVVDGREVLLHQGLAQFEAMTGGPLPFEVGAAALGLESTR